MTIAFTLDNFRITYICIATFMWVVSLVLSYEYMRHYERKGRFYIFTLLTYVATVGVFLAADFYTMFIFFEIMSLASYVWVAFDERAASLRAADTYLAIAIIGGLTMLMGLFLLYDAVTDIGMDGSLRFNSLKYLYDSMRLMGDDRGVRQIWAAGLCMLVGFGAKAGAFPLHIWLPKAHPVAPAPASALLSGMLTKTGILGILMLSRYIFLPIFADKSSWSALILITGVLTMATGAVLAIFSVDIKRTLACSSVSQIGFILTGIGVSGLAASDLALSGSLLHMVGHSVFKLILFAAAGVIYMNVHKLDLNSLRGYGRRKPLLKLIFLSGALGIGGIPLFNGYISKTLIHEGITALESYMYYGGAAALSYDIIKYTEWIFLISGGCTVAYMLKLYICIFVEKNKDADIQAVYDEGKPYMNRATATALTVAALIPPALGLTPGYTMRTIVDICADALVINRDAEYMLESFFTSECLKGAIISIAIGIVIYAGIIRNVLMTEEDEYTDKWPGWLDLEDKLYRPVVLYALPFVAAVVCRFLDKLVDITIYFLRKGIFADSGEKEELAEGNRLTYCLGVIAGKLNRIRRRYLKLKGVRVGKPVNFVHKFAMDYESLKESRTVIFRSMSFGLMMFCLGLVLTVAYILITRWW